MLNIAWPWMLLTLPLPALVYWLFPVSVSSKSALKVPFFNSVSSFSQRSTFRNSKIRLVVLTLIWLLLVIAAVRPQWVGEVVNVPISGRDLMLAVDVSGSMKAKDMVFKNEPQDRLAAVKRVAGEFIGQRIGDRVGLVLFGTRAYLQVPLTLDRHTVDQLLQESAIGIAGEKTAIGDAIGLTLKRLKDRKSNDKVLILLTDGSNTAGTLNPVKAAELAQVAGLKIHTIGVGADQLRVKDFFGSRMVNPSSDLDEQTLTTIAQLTGGQYFRARDNDALANIYRLIDELEPVEENTEHLRPTKELYHWPLSISVLISLLSTILLSSLAADLVHRLTEFRQPKMGQ